MSRGNAEKSEKKGGPLSQSLISSVAKQTNSICSGKKGCPESQRAMYFPGYAVGYLQIESQKRRIPDHSKLLQEYLKLCVQGKSQVCRASGNKY